MRCLLFFSSSIHPVSQYGSAKVKLSLQTGFTLLELLVVLAILSIIAGTVVLGLQGLQDQGRSDARKFEMAELRKALLQFRRDSGSNDFPKDGRYDCDDDPSGESTALNTELTNLPSYISSLSPAEKVAWCKSDANFWMLFENPLPDDNNWDEDTRRGWNGPYLQNKGALEPYLGIDDIPTVTSAYGSPYLLLDESTATANIVSMGENSSAGTVTDCHSNDDDDYVVCLLK